MRFSTMRRMLVIGGLAQLVLGEEQSTAQTRQSSTASLASQTTPMTAVTQTGKPEWTLFNDQRVPAMKELGGETLAEQLKDGYTLAKFYSPHCIHCQHVAPIYQTLYEFYWTSKPLASTTTSEVNDQSHMNDFHHFYNGFDFVAVNCLAFGDTCQKYSVHAYPTFILFKGAEEVEQFTGAKDIKGLSKFVEKHLETIRPGSRKEGGPDLPKAGDKVAPSVDAVPVPTKSPEIPATRKLKAPAKSNAWDRPAKSTDLVNPAGNSTKLNPQTFEEKLIKSQDAWFVKFYAPWCGHCQALAPVWTQMAKEMQGKLNIGEVNCDRHKGLCKEAGVRGYPTMILYSGGQQVEYEGLRGLGDLVKYANSVAAVEAGVRDVDLESFKKLEESEDVIFVFFYDQATTSEDFDALDRMTLSLIGHARLVKTKDPAMFERYKITTWPKLIVSREGRPTYYHALSPRDTRDFRTVLRWMHSVWLPLVPELTAMNSRDIMDGKIVVLGVLSRDRPDEFMAAKKELKSAAMEWMDKQTQLFQLERQELRDAKQLRIEEAEDRDDQRSLRAAKQIRIDMEHAHHKEVGFAWVDGVFWERWLRSTYGIDVVDGERIIINDEDNRVYWDTTASGNDILPSRTSILETLPKVVKSPPSIRPKLTVSSLYKLFLDIKNSSSEHPWATAILVLVTSLVSFLLYRARVKRNRGGFFRLDEKELLLGSNNGGKVD